MTDVTDSAVKYNENILKSLEKIKKKSLFYSSLTGGSKIVNAITGAEYPFLSGSKYEYALWKVIVADNGKVLYYDSPEEWLRHKKKNMRYDSDDLKSTTNLVLWYEPSKEDIISMKANGKKKIPKYVAKINPVYKEQWESRKRAVLNQ